MQLSKQNRNVFGGNVEDETAYKLMEEMKQGVYRDTLKDIYIDESVIAHQEERYVKAMAEYQKLYGDREVEVYSTGTK